MVDGCLSALCRLIVKDRLPLAVVDVHPIGSSGFGFRIQVFTSKVDGPLRRGFLLGEGTTNIA